MKNKIILFVSVLLIAVASAFAINGSFVKANDEATSASAPHLNVRVLQHLSSNPQKGAEVVYTQNGVEIHNATTNSDGWVFHTLNPGTYRVSFDGNHLMSGIYSTGCKLRVIQRQ